MPESDSLYQQHLESLIQTTNEISRHTNAWDSFISGSITIITIIAAVATSLGIIMVYFELQRRHFTKERQSLVIKDLVRHLFINCAILEALEIKSNNQWQSVHPAEGVFSRFTVLNSDLLLDNINVSDKQFVKLHSLSVFLRNYNITVEIAEKHFLDSSIPNSVKMDDITEIWKRTGRLVKELIELGTAANLLNGSNKHLDSSIKNCISKKEVAGFIREYYQEKNVSIIVSSNLPIRIREKALFDAPDFGLKDEFDKRITDRLNDIKIVSFNYA